MFFFPSGLTCGGHMVARAGVNVFHGGGGVLGNHRTLPWLWGVPSVTHQEATREESPSRSGHLADLLIVSAFTWWKQKLRGPAAPGGCLACRFPWRPWKHICPSHFPGKESVLNPRCWAQSLLWVSPGGVPSAHSRTEWRGCLFCAGGDHLGARAEK